MPKISIESLGAIGLSPDLPQYELPPNGWTYVLNARPVPGGMLSIVSHANNALDTAGSSSFGVWFYEKEGLNHWVTVNGTKIRASKSGVSYEIATGTFDPDYRWNGCQIGNYLIMNSGEFDPYMWDGNTAGTAVALTNWPASTKAKVIRTFKQFLFALDITESGIHYEQMVWWSHPAEPNAVPETWDYTDTDKLAGRVPLYETPGRVVDAAPLGDIFVIYKTDAVFGATLIGGNSIFRFYTITKAFGAVATNCVGICPAGHVVLTRDDVILHRGEGEHQSILSQKAREFFFAQLSQASLQKCFVTTQPNFKEVWIHFPYSDEDTETADAAVKELNNLACNAALTWNWETGAIGLRETPRSFAGATGFVNFAPADNWDSETSLAWNSIPDVWNAGKFSVSGHHLVLVGQSSAVLSVMDVYDPAVDIPTMILEREDLSIVGRRADGSPRVDSSSRKIFSEIWPRQRLSGDGTFKIYFGKKRDQTSAVAWKNGMNIVVAETYRAKARGTSHINTVYPCIRATFEVASGAYGQILFSSYDLLVELAGDNFG